jgi:ABC-type sugar transport system ATPase subunit/ribose/xylose/arabinose/galactoside ABC-type transport system permease subunit
MTGPPSEAPVEDMQEIALACTGITKQFPGVLALKGVDFEVRRGEIHALVGENGAGKSTLVKILTGVYQPDAGQIVLDGIPVQIPDPQAAADHGIAIVHQDSALVAQFDATRNVFLGRELTTRASILDFGTMRAATAESLQLVGAQFGPDTLVRDLTVGHRELVAIASALVQRPKILIFDEPTASLSADEVQRLFAIVRSLKDRGATVVYISHHLDEVQHLADRITVLRDGMRAGTLDMRTTDRAAIIRLMIGRDLTQLYPKDTEVPLGAPILEVRNLAGGSAVRDVSLTVRRGEIHGVAGLVGAGRSETALMIFGAEPHTRGDIVFDGKPYRAGSPLKARDAGLALIPEDRRTEGLVTSLSVRENLTLSNLRRWARFGLINSRAERKTAQGLVDTLRIATPSLDQLTRNLSGGNQQKVVIGRWFAGDSKLFMFDEPTTGVDVGAKVEIYNQMTRAARDGAGVMFISSDFEELLGMCDRISVMKKGRVVKEFDRGEANLHDLMHWATGADGTGPGPAAGEAIQGQALAMRPLEPLPAGATASETVADLQPAHADVVSDETVRLRSRGDQFGDFLTRWGTITGMILAILVIGLNAPQFFAPDNLFSVLKQGSILTLLAFGITLVLIAGGFDMSVGALSQLTSNLAAGAMVQGLGMWFALAMGGVLGIAFGLLNALLVIVIRIPSFVATLGTMFIAMGATFWFNAGRQITLRDQPDFFFLGQGYIGPVPFIFILVVILMVILQFGLKRTRPGLRMYAVGENLAAARLRGVSQPRALLTAFLLTGVVVGSAGVLLASYSYGSSALGTGLDYLISALAAAYLGTAFSKAGELDMVGTAISAMFITALGNGLIINGVSSVWLPGIQGAVLILAIMLGTIRKRDIGQVTIF